LMVKKVIELSSAEARRCIRQLLSTCADEAVAFFRRQRYSNHYNNRIYNIIMVLY
jgi:hypothetical protein